jgi:CubicO group peptidase (beta-lactamase class C family)
MADRECMRPRPPSAPAPRAASRALACGALAAAVALVACFDRPACPPCAEAQAPGSRPAAAPARSAPSASQSGPALAAAPGSPPAGSARPAPGPAARRFDDDVPQPGFFPRAEPPEAGLDRAALDDLILEAERTHSDSLVVVQDGRTIVERYFGRPRGPIETMSVTKSIVSLAIGLLIEERRIASIDTPMHTFFPEWKTGRKAGVTLRHVLTHTSGIEHKKGAAVLNAQADRLAYARKRPLADDPGKTFSYNNEATQLLSGVVRAAAGVDADAYLKKRLFEPLGIKDFAWARDQARNVQTYYGLALRARDLARIGQLLLDGGALGAKSIVPPAWVKLSTRPGSEATPSYGLLWWLRFDRVQWALPRERAPELRSLGVASIESLEPLLGRAFGTREGFFLEAGALLGPEERGALAAAQERGLVPLVSRPGSQIGFYADGWLGQRLAVYPAARVVAVRQHRKSEGGDDAENEKLGFGGFLKKLEAAVAAEPAGGAVAPAAAASR